MRLIGFVRILIKGITITAHSVVVMLWLNTAGRWGRTRLEGVIGKLCYIPTRPVHSSCQLRNQGELSSSQTCFFMNLGSQAVCVGPWGTACQQCSWLCVCAFKGVFSGLEKGLQPLTPSSSTWVPQLQSTGPTVTKIHLLKSLL